MNIKAGDKVRVKTLPEMVDYHGHTQFSNPEFFEKHGNKTYYVVRISNLSAGPGNPIVIMDINGDDIGIILHGVEKVIFAPVNISVEQLPKDLFEL